MRSCTRQELIIEKITDDSMQFFDTHAHINFNAFKDDGEEVLRRCIDNGVSVVNVGSQYSTSKRAVEYAHRGTESPKGDSVPRVYAAVGIHPAHLKKGSFTYVDPGELSEEEIHTVGEKFDREKYLELAKDEKVVAIGEVGLDYYYFGEDDDVEVCKKLQKETFVEFITLADEVQKPLLIHCRDAYDDLLEILQAKPVDKKGIIHCFVGSYKTAQKFIDLGYLIGLNGIITYGNSYDRLIREIGLENIVLETDCPYLTPRPLDKGTRNEPQYVKLVVEKIADVLEVPVDKVADKTTENAKFVLGL